ncbi:hypothetical protein KC361_g198 [Hortaea werneckii]|nr:hypothetical protein KC361_g198 [Hortaea werneckii]
MFVSLCPFRKTLCFVILLPGNFRVCSINARSLFSFSSASALRHSSMYSSSSSSVISPNPYLRSFSILSQKRSAAFPSPRNRVCCASSASSAHTNSYMAKTGPVTPHCFEIAQESVKFEVSHIGDDILLDEDSVDWSEELLEVVWRQRRLASPDRECLLKKVRQIECSKAA